MAELSFIDDWEKMRDFFDISREEFLASYSYLTEEEYDATLADVKALNEKGIDMKEVPAVVIRGLAVLRYWMEQCRYHIEQHFDGSLWIIEEDTGNGEPLDIKKTLDTFIQYVHATGNPSNDNDIMDMVLLKEYMEGHKND